MFESRITEDMSLIDIETLLGEDFVGFLMECRPSSRETRCVRPLSEMRSSYGPVQLERMMRGFRLLERLVSEGKKLAFDIYSEEEKRSDETKRRCRLFFLPGKAGAPFALLLPGGAYRSVCSNVEGFPAAAELVQHGYNVFVLSYRTRVEEEGQRPLALPIEDVARAVEYIFAHADDFAVGMRYTVWGWSAGAHLAGEWGTANWGARRWGLPQPQALMLGYPISDFHTMIHGPEDASEPFFRTILGNPASMEQLDEFSICTQMDAGFPATFTWQCADDDVVPFENHRLLCDALFENGVRYQAVSFGRGNHGLMRPHDPEADRWPELALAFVDAVLNVAPAADGGL